MIFTTNGKLQYIENVDSISSLSDTRFSSKVYSGQTEYKCDQTVKELLELNYPKLKEKIKCLEFMLNVTKKK